MKTFLAAAALVAGLNGIALADVRAEPGGAGRGPATRSPGGPTGRIDVVVPQVDRSIDRAAARILAGRIGNLRGGFAPGVEPSFVRSVSAETTASTTRAAPAPSRHGVWIDGLARASDPLAGRLLADL
ncbi:hypothetical protein [Aquibium microcysteis]|uniref:hypothetical protein n=1 Tax=Aquibium microcysteis TaxID=675281 RepID=UPI00165CF428|nr:hypothetical protein [Aquibium microcysteis]